MVDRVSTEIREMLEGALKAGRKQGHTFTGKFSSLCRGTAAEIRCTKCRAEVFVWLAERFAGKPIGLAVITPCDKKEKP